MKRIIYFAASLLAFAFCNANAVDHIVIAKRNPNRFDPATLEIAVGDTVTFINDPDNPGFHNVVSDVGSVTDFRCANGCDGTGGNGDASSDLWSATVLFDTAGVAPYYCEIHGGSGGSGMAGTITVVGGGGAPVIGVDPTSIAVGAEVGQSTTVPLSISNTGDADLTWTADMASADCATPDLVPWLSLNPTSGTVAAGDPADTVDVTLDAASLAEGVYNANVCIHSNDAANDLVSVPVAFTVSTPDLIFADGFE